MITPKIKALFQFIEYLHSNIDNFNLNNDLIKELELLNEERQKVSSKKTFKDKLKYDEVQAEIETKFKILQGNTANLIKAKAKELNVCNFDNEPNYSFNGIEADILQLKENFSKDDLPEIFKHKQQYIEYRTKTHRTFLSLAFFIDKLDRVTKSLFDYFKETEQNEFEAFEIKAIPVNSIAEAIQGFKKGQTKFTLPTNILFNTSTSKALPPQPIKTKQPTEKKTLSDLITHQKSVEIVEGIKIRYKNIKGKRLKLLLLALQELNLLPKERIAKKFYNCCKAEFGWDVASYTAMNDYQFNEYTDKIELDNMKKFLEEIIQTK